MISHYKKTLITALKQTRNNIPCLLVPFMLSASNAWAGTMGVEPPAYNYEGFYVGGMMGVSDFTNKQEYMVNPGSAQLGAEGFLGGLFVGFDYIFYNDFNIEIEGYGNGFGGLPGTATKTTLPIVSCTTSGMTTTVNYDAPSSSTVSFSTPYSTGIRILPGYQIREGGQFHFIVGWTYSSFNISDSGSYGVINRSFSGSGLETGLGWETPITNPILLRLDLLYTMFGTYDVVGKGLAGTSAINQTYQMHPTPMSGVISLIYRP